MTIRPILPDEHFEFDRVQHVAFGAAFNAEAKRAKPPSPPEKLRGHIAGFEDGKIIAGIIADPYTISYDGHDVGMIGVGGVVSLPEKRRRGNVRALFAHVFEHAEETVPGALYSALFPFSHAYYRQFGYEAAAMPGVIADLALLRAFPCAEDVSLLGDGAELADFARVHEDFRLRCNGIGLRGGEEDWKDVLREGIATPSYAYLTRDAGGAPNAYIVIEKTREPLYSLRLRDIAYRDSAALRGLLGFLYRLHGQHHAVDMTLPTGEAPWAWFPEGIGMSFSMRHDGMVRLLNARCGLALMLHPRGCGGYAVAVRDAFLPRNDGVYRVDYQDGKAEAVRDDNAVPDLRVSIEALALLTLGAMALDEAEGREDVEVLAKEDALRRIFIRKRFYLPDRY